MPINLVADELTRFNLPLTSSFFEAQSDFGHVRDNTRTGDALRALPLGVHQRRSHPYAVAVCAQDRSEAPAFFRFASLLDAMTFAQEVHDEAETPGQTRIVDGGVKRARRTCAVLEASLDAEPGGGIYWEPHARDAQPPFFRHWSAAEQEARAARQG